MISEALSAPFELWWLGAFWLAAAGLVTTVSCLALLHRFDRPLFLRGDAGTAEVPRGTGVLLVASFAVCLGVAFWQGDGLDGPPMRISGLLLGLSVIVGIGIWDDISELGVSTKLVAQFVAAIVALGSGFALQMPAGMGWLGGITTILWILAVTNAMNFIDGSDGLCATQAIVALLSFALLGTAMSGVGVDGGASVTVLACIAAGSTIAFLPYNLPRARYHLGDAGSTFLGYLLSLLGILTANAASHSAHGSTLGTIAGLLVPVAVLGLPLADATRVIVGRIARRQSPFMRDRSHLHHRWCDAGRTPTEILAVAGAVGAVTSPLAAIVASQHLLVVVSSAAPGLAIAVSAFSAARWKAHAARDTVPLLKKVESP